MVRFLNVATSTGVALLALAGGNAHAQWFGGGGNCNCNAPVAAAMATASYAAPTVTACSVCAPVVQTVCAPPVQPVMQTVYRQVPVTEYQPVKEIAKRQVLETKYVDQAITAYRPITETKVAEVPAVTYQNVTECQTQYRNVGYWRTRCEPNARMSPCQYDQRPGLAGWFNRTSYEMQTAFTPAYRTTREYVPQVVAQAVPVTRQVAVQTSRQVSYNVTRMEPYQTTQKVAISVPRWEDHEVTVMKPITVVKTMAVGTQVAYVPLGAGTTATAFGPSPDPIGTARGPSPERRVDLLKESDPTKVNGGTRGAIEPMSPVIDPRVIPAALPREYDPESYRPRTVADVEQEVEEEVLVSSRFVKLGRSAPLPFPSKLEVTAAKPELPRMTSTPGSARAAQWVARSSKSASPATAPATHSVVNVDRP